MALIKTTLVWLVTLGSMSYIAVVAGYLQEFHGDDIPEAAASVGVRLPLEDPRIVVSVYKSTLSLFDGDVLVKRYTAGHGQEVEGRCYNRVGSTPIGEFHVVERHVRDDVLERGSRFLVINFPSEDYADRAFEVDGITLDEYHRLVRHRDPLEVPPCDTALGGPLGIQGNFFFYRQTRFTDGSIALSNADINELFEYVPVGTPVIIER